MKNTLIPALIPALIGLLCLPLLAQAETYKCRQPNGSLAFQDHPCQNGATGAKVELAPVQGYTAVPLGQASAPSAVPVPQTPATAADAHAAQRQNLNNANDKLQADNARMKAENPNWDKSQTLTRLNNEAEAINARVKADNSQGQQ